MADSEENQQPEGEQAAATEEGQNGEQREGDQNQSATTGEENQTEGQEAVAAEEGTEQIQDLGEADAIDVPTEQAGEDTTNEDAISMKADTSEMHQDEEGSTESAPQDQAEDTKISVGESQLEEGNALQEEEIEQSEVEKTAEEDNKEEKEEPEQDTQDVESTGHEIGQEEEKGSDSQVEQKGDGQQAEEDVGELNIEGKEVDRQENEETVSAEDATEQAIEEDPGETAETDTKELTGEAEQEVEATVEGEGGETAAANEEAGDAPQDETAADKGDEVQAEADAEKTAQSLEEQPAEGEPAEPEQTADEPAAAEDQASEEPAAQEQVSEEPPAEAGSAEPTSAKPEAAAEEPAEAEVKETDDVGNAQEEVGIDKPEEEGAGDQAGEALTEKEQSTLEDGQLQMTQEQSDLNQSASAPNTQEDLSVPPAPPHLPTPVRSHTSIEGQMSTSALNIVWSFGLNRNVPVLNLSDGMRQAIMYPCAHVGIMYDFKNNKQHTLQAHLNPITCSAVSQDKRWLVTGDVGPDAMVNIWDTYTGTPIQTMFDPNPSGGVVAVALTPDSRYLATLSALPVQTLAVWDWTVDGDVPICSADLKPEYGLQNFIYFDPTDIHHVVTNSETQVLFYHWDETKMNYYAPPLSDQDFNKPVGRYSQSIFQMGIARALTATSIGNLVVWDNNKPLSKFMDVNQSADKKPLKIIKVHDRGINVLTTTDHWIVLGDTAGHVKFYDQGLRLIYWYADFNSGPCTAISFSHKPNFIPIPSEGQRFPSDATKQAKPFVVRDFVVGTSIAVYGNVTTDGSKFKVIHREHDAAVHALAAHPKLPIIAMGSYSGLLKLWNYRTKETVASRFLDKAHIQCCTFDPRGLNIAIGCTNGAVYIVDSVALLDQLNEPYKYAKDVVTHIAFSHNSTYLATADSGCAVTVFKRQRKSGRNPYIWHGRYRSHYKPIREMVFGTHLDTDEPKLLTLGEDRMLIEYELNHSGKTKNKVVPIAEDRIEQSAMTQCMCWYPPITKENFILTANDQFKLKCYNSTTKMCRKTVLGPTYGSPIQKMMVVPTTGKDDKDRYLAYITDDKVGLHFLPATGNPHLAMALIAHPSGISNLACSYDGVYLFTAGGPDYAVHMWEINITALEAQAKLGGEDLIPFYGLLEGGRDGEMFAELEDLFYYAQLRHQGINSMETREIGNRVPISEVPYIMRAMGYYPSEQEIEDMLNEIKYDEYVNLGHYQEDIDLGSFIKLYINHRPAFGLSPEKLLWAFHTLAADPDTKGGYIERGDLLNLLQKKGEHMTEYELAEHLTTLLGFNREGGSCEQEMFDAENAGLYIANNLPFDITSEIFINEILGFSMTVDPPAAEDAKELIRSGSV